jgi:phosphatidylethanolamine N-methyltransferase
MTYVTFIILFYQLYQPTARYLLLNTIGVLFIVIHIWISLSVYEVLGLKAMFHYDFFLDVKDKKKYSQLGIYKYWRHPMLYTFSCWGMVLISSSWDLFWVTCFGQVCNYIFLLVVEKPHLEQVYGIGLEAQEEKNLEDDTLDSISEDLFTDPTILFSIGNEDSEDSESEKSEPSRSSLVQKTFEKLEGFVNDTAKPHMQTIIQKTRRSVVTLANHAKLEDSLSLKDLPLDLYGIKFTKPPQNGELIYELGEQIEIEFTGCRETMKQKDWIGIYPTNSNPDKSLTTVSSQNKWLTICGNTTTKDLQQLLFYKTNKIDYCGETVVEISKSVYPGLRTVKGNILFKKHHLPWKTGVYEFRYHYDEKYEVLAISVPIRIIIKVPERVDLNRITQEEFTDLLRYNIKRSLDLDDLELFEDHKSLLEMVKVPEDITGIY